jgi:hypothetical protein
MAAVDRAVPPRAWLQIEELVSGRDFPGKRRAEA